MNRDKAQRDYDHYFGEGSALRDMREGYWPTLRVDYKRNGAVKSTSIGGPGTEPDVQHLRRACVTLGIGYYDGEQTIGRTI